MQYIAAFGTLAVVLVLPAVLVAGLVGAPNKKAGAASSLAAPPADHPNGQH